MTPRRLPAADRPATPWRNGGGLTREVAAAAAGGWRVSLAEIASDGPFSAFPGLDRILTVVAGTALELTVGEEPPVRLPALRPYAFPGAAATAGRLPAGPVTALNVMTRQPLHATVEILTAPAELRPAPGATVLAVALDGQDALLLTHPDQARVAGRTALITIAAAQPLQR